MGPKGVDKARVAQTRKSEGDSNPVKKVVVDAPVAAAKKLGKWVGIGAHKQKAAESNGVEAAAKVGEKEAFSQSGLSVAQLRRTMPNLSEAKAEKMLPHLNRAMKEFNIDNPKRAAAFLAQLAHESGELKYFEELASGRAYEGRRDLGNTQPGDGVHFKGRGPIQLTGRHNYEKAGKALGIDLVNHPELASRPDIGFRVAAWFWQNKGLNKLADKGEFNEITRRVNGGFNGAASRNQYYAKAQAALGGGMSGGPMSTTDTEVPEWRDSETPRGYRMPQGSTFETADPHAQRMVRAYAERSRLDMNELYIALLLMMAAYEGRDLALDPEFVAYAKELGWQEGTPIPEALAQEFITDKLAKIATENPEGLRGAIDQVRRSLPPESSQAPAALEASPAVEEARSRGVAPAFAARSNAPGAELGPSVLSMARALLRGGGGPSDDGAAARLLSADSGLGRTLRMFAPAFDGAPAAGRDDVALKALRHHAANGGEVSPTLQRALGDPVAAAGAYAKDLGFDNVLHDGVGWILGGSGPPPAELKNIDPKDLYGSLTRAVNEHRFSTASVLPPQAPADVTAKGFDLDSAQLGVHLSTLAYQPRDVVKAQLDAWGFDVSTFKWIEDPATDTQGFVVADKRGNVFPVFRGSESATDWRTNVQVQLQAPQWSSPAGVHVHQGFSTALDTVWPEVRAAIAQAKAKAGPQAKVMFAGHSLGGALTQLAAVRAASEGLVDPARTSVYTLGSPRAGDEGFRLELERLIPSAFRLVNFDDRVIDVQDAVTQVPPKALGFRHAGALVRLGPEQLRVIDRGPDAALRGLEAARPVDDTDIANPEVERLRGRELEQYIARVMSETTQSAAPPAAVGATAERMVMPSASAHSTGVYLDRTGVQVLARR